MRSVMGPTDSGSPVRMMFDSIISLVTVAVSTFALSAPIDST